MSVTNMGNSGHLAKASEFTKLLPEDKREEYTNAITDKNIELVNLILGEQAPKGFPSFESAVFLGEEEGIDPEAEGMYVCFQNDDLYVRTPKPELNFLLANGIHPWFQQWASWN